MSDRPTIYLTNAASRKPPQRGPGRVWTIMARPRPRYGEAGEGAVTELVPRWEWVDHVRQGVMPMEEYRHRYYVQLFDRDLWPGSLVADTGEGHALVEDGDTLLCACSRGAAAQGRCHRAWAALYLGACGWRVVLDGKVLE